MGMLLDGRWSKEDRTLHDGAYVRPASPFSACIPAELIRDIGAEPGRFHLIASRSCPWSHRTILARTLKDLEAALPLHVATGPRTQGYRMGTADRPWRVPGTNNRIEHLHELYTLAEPRLTARSTVPVLWDAAAQRIVSNDSARILRALDAVEVKGSAGADWTLAPHHLHSEIAALSDRIQSGLSNAVYRSGKARRQDVYDVAVDEVFDTLDMLENRLSETRFLHGRALTETDLRLWPTLIRFDLVYHGHFKCARRRLVDFPNLWAYARDLLALPGVAATFDPDAIRKAYYGEDRDLNPTGLVAAAPELDWHAYHDRDSLSDRRVWRRSGASVPFQSVTAATGATKPCCPPANWRTAS
ncbi:MAG: glutathione S-transferase C-terminal domain-containing protein [Pseudomonadota bacterium]